MPSMDRNNQSIGRNSDQSGVINAETVCLLPERCVGTIFTCLFCYAILETSKKAYFELMLGACLVTGR